MNYADKLRRFADYLDEHPDLPISDWEYPGLWVSTSDAESFGKACASMGSFEKNGYDGILEAIHTEDEDPEHYSPTVFTVRVSVSGVCKKVETDEVRTRKVYIPSNAVQNDEGEWVITEPVVTYDCPDSFLNLANPTE